MKLFFKDKYSRLRQIGTVNNATEAWTIISNFLKNYNYTCHYVRTWITQKDNKFYVVYDVGSHSEFFKVECSTQEEANNFIKIK